MRKTKTDLDLHKLEIFYWVAEQGQFLASGGAALVKSAYRKRSYSRIGEIPGRKTPLPDPRPRKLDATGATSGGARA